MESTYDIVAHYSSGYWFLLCLGLTAGVAAFVVFLIDRPRGARATRGLKSLVLQIRHDWEAALVILALLAFGIAMPTSQPQSADSVTAALESAGYSQVEIGNLKHG